MFEKETKFLYDFSMNQIKQLGSYITFDELSGAGLHPAVTRYISAEIEYLINEDRQRLLNSSNFDYSGEEINKFFTLITKEIKRTKKFSLDYIGNIILHAISFNVNYLAQPNWSLTKLIFAKDPVLKTNEVLQILKYVYYYDYLPELIKTYVKKKNLLNVEKNEIEALLVRADREIFDNTSSGLVDKVLFAMGEFVNIGSFNKTKIPLLMFELYLKEKKLDEYWEKLESALGTDIKQVYEIPDIRKILHSPASHAKKENYLDRLMHQDKPLGLFRRESKQDLQEEPEQQKEHFVNEEPVNIEEAVNIEEPANIEELLLEKEPLQDNSLPAENSPLQEEELPQNSDSHIPENEEDPLPADVSLSGEESLLEGFAIQDTPEDSHTEDEQPLSVELEQVTEEIEIEIKAEDDIIFLEDETENLLTEPGKSLWDFKTLASAEEAEENNKIKEAFEFNDAEALNDESGIINDEELKEIINIDEGSEQKDISELKDEPGLNDFPEFKDEPEMHDFQNELENFFSSENRGNEDDVSGELEIKDIAEKEIPEKPETGQVDNSSGEQNDEELILRYLEESEPDNRPGFAAARKKELTGYFSQREMHKIVGSVFNDNMKSLAQTFEELEKCRDLSEAQSVLNSVFVSNMVSPDSKGAKILKKNLSKYFNQV